MNIRASLAQVEADILNLSARLERIRDCSVHSVVNRLEKEHARAQAHRLILLCLCRDRADRTLREIRTCHT